MSEPFYDPSERSDDDLTREEFEQAVKEPIDDGGPAFPVTDSDHAHSAGVAACLGASDPNERDRKYLQARSAAVRGMSLRDWFAGMALQGFCAHPEIGNSLTDEKIARYAVAQADAVIAARGQNKPPRTITAQALLDAYNLGDSLGNNGPHLLRTSADLVQTFAPHTAAELRRKADAEDRALDLVRDGKEVA